MHHLINRMIYRLYRSIHIITSIEPYIDENQMNDRDIFSMLDYSVIIRDDDDDDRVI